MGPAQADGKAYHVNLSTTPLSNMKSHSPSLIKRFAKEVCEG